MQEQITVDVYCRSANGEQNATNTLDEQEQICRDYCVAKGLTVGTVYREVAAGFQLKARPMLSRLRQHCQEDAIQGIVVTRLDRLVNSNLHLVLLVNEMEVHNIQLYVVQEELVDSLQGRWILALSAFLTKANVEKTLEL